MANTTGTYTVGLKDERGMDLGRMLIEQAYVTGVASYLSPAYLGPIAEKSNYAFKSGATTYNLDDIYVRNAYWQEGNLLNWGNNTYGQIGDGAGGLPSYSPVQTSAGYLTWRRGSAGYQHSSAIGSDGTLWSWGYNYYGQLGDNTQTDKSRPVQIGTATTWWQVDCGGWHSAFIKNDGTLWTTGNNDAGQLGTNNAFQVSSPVQVGTNTTWRQVACGGFSTAAIKSDNSLWVWGNNYSGNLGTNNTTNYSSPVQTVTAGTTWKQVSVGGKHGVLLEQTAHMAAIKTDGTLWCWGYNVYGQLGDNTRTDRSSPVQTVAGGSNWKWVSCGAFHTAAIKRDGTLWCWGYNYFGQLGDNTTTSRSSPVQTISGGTTWREVSCGGYTTYGIKTDGTLWAWGYNSAGQGGFDLTGAAKSSPTQTLIGGTAWRGVDGGYVHVLAFSYTEGQFGVPIPPPAPSV